MKVPDFSWRILRADTWPLAPKASAKQIVFVHLDELHSCTWVSKETLATTNRLAVSSKSLKDKI